MINILVCDDDKDIVDAIEIYLAPEGYRILKAYDGIQAIEMMRKNDDAAYGWYPCNLKDS